MVQLLQVVWWIVGAIKACRLHTEVKSLVTLETSDPFLDQLWAVGQATRLNNIHSYFEDCTRERFGYGGDIVALLPTQMADLGDPSTSFVADHLSASGSKAERSVGVWQ